MLSCTVSHSLKVGQVYLEFLGSGINSSHLVDSLNSLGGKAKSDIAVQLLGEESLPLEVDVLDLFDSLVGKGDHACLAVGGLSEQIANSGSHFHGRSSVSCGGDLKKKKNIKLREKKIDETISLQQNSHSPKTAPLFGS